MGIPKKEIGKRIKFFRERAGFDTQEALASALNTDQSRVSRWETGYASPGIYKDALLRLLNVSEQDIFGFVTLTDLAQPAFQPREPENEAISEALIEITRLSRENAEKEQQINALIAETDKLKAEVNRLKVHASSKKYVKAAIDYLNRQKASGVGAESKKASRSKKS